MSLPIWLPPSTPCKLASFVRLARTLRYLLFAPTVRKTQAGLLSILMESSPENRKTSKRFFKTRSFFPGDFLDDRLAILKSRSFNTATPGDLRRNHNICARTPESLLKLQNLRLSMKLDRALLHGIERA